MIKCQKFLKICELGFCCGILNGLLGAGAGMILIPGLISNGVQTKKTHATCVCTILFLSILSAFIYIVNGKVSLGDVFLFLPGGILGSLVGSFVLQKISTDLLKKFFGIIMIWVGIRMLF